ncbi:MAG: MoxR family ATPase [Planctomycetota bacterium]|nr:MAG: MoxR family ATPase [Planctomycetota bacterium]REK20374.1 MAG: MoxR family ATPase [Planctomycetota bacterium]REK26871.1 MAG: MoxR family ATPase [Planctomycetota bacterium]
MTPLSYPEPPLSLESLYNSVRDEISKVIFGQDEVIDFALAALFSSGHVLLEGPPGVAKTLLVRTIAAALNLDYRRIQMTPDLLPNDITGSSVYRDDTHSFEFRPGPIFTHFVLADEINRASARTQSAMLEAMQELHVTYDGVQRNLPEPFITFATQNPIEQEGTYPLPLAQLDRFMFKVLVDYPPADEEQRVLREHHATGGLSDPQRMGVSPVVAAEDIIGARQVIRDTIVREEVIGYIQRMMQATRDDDLLSVGASPRSGLMLLMGAKSLARFAGRDFVTPDDVKAALIPGLRHRVVLSPSAELEGVTTDDVLTQLMEAVEVPR